MCELRVKLTLLSRYTWTQGSGHAVAQLVEALRYKPEGRGFDSRWYNLSDRTMALGLTQPLIEMSTRNISWGGVGVKATDNLTTFMCRQS